MRRTVLAIAAAVLGATPIGAQERDCRCLANGQTYRLGETVCLPFPGGARKVRCDMVLNNTSWTEVGRDCLDLSQATGSARTSLASVLETDSDRTSPQQHTD